MLRRIVIKDYKSLVNVDVELQPLSVLFGPNAAGKSNFLDALAFLRDVVETSLTKTLIYRGGWPAVSCHTAETSSISFEVEVGFKCRKLVDRAEDLSTTIIPGLPTPPPEGTLLVANYGFEFAPQPQGGPVLTREFFLPVTSLCAPGPQAAC